MQAAARHARGPAIVPKIDLSHIQKPGDVLKAVLAKKHEEEEEARHARYAGEAGDSRRSLKCAPWRHAGRLATPVATKPAAATSARPEPRKIVPQPRSAPPIIAAPPAAPAIASRPPAGVIVAKPPAGVVPARPVVVVRPPGGVIVKPPAIAAVREEKIAAQEKPAAKAPAAAPADCSRQTPAAAIVSLCQLRPEPLRFGPR